MNLRKPLTGLFFVSLLLILGIPAARVVAEDDVIMPGDEVQSEQTVEPSPTPDAPTVASSTDETVTPSTEETSTTSPTIPDWFLHDHPWSRGSTTDASSTPNWFERFFDFSNWFHHGDDGDATTTPNSTPVLHAPLIHPKTTPPGGRGPHSEHERVSGEVITVRNSSVVITAGGHASTGLARGESRTEATITVQLPPADPSVRPRTIVVGQRIIALGTSVSEGNFMASSVRILADATPAATTTAPFRTWSRPLRPTTTRHGR